MIPRRLLLSDPRLDLVMRQRANPRFTFRPRNRPLRSGEVKDYVAAPILRCYDPEVVDARVVMRIDLEKL